MAPGNRAAGGLARRAFWLTVANTARALVAAVVAIVGIPALDRIVSRPRSAEARSSWIRGGLPLVTPRQVQMRRGPVVGGVGVAGR
jgi:hypothetical protein